MNKSTPNKKTGKIKNTKPLYADIDIKLRDKFIQKLHERGMTIKGWMLINITRFLNVNEDEIKGWY